MAPGVKEKEVDMSDSTTVSRPRFSPSRKFSDTLSMHCVPGENLRIIAFGKSESRKLFSSWTLQNTTYLLLQCSLYLTKFSQRGSRKGSTRGRQNRFTSCGHIYDRQKATGHSESTTTSRFSAAQRLHLTTSYCRSPGNNPAHTLLLWPWKVISVSVGYLGTHQSRCTWHPEVDLHWFWPI